MRTANNAKRKMIFAAAMLLVFSAGAFVQMNCSLSGSVQDASQAALSGATVTAINHDTGVRATTSTNSAGMYSFPSLQPGTYKVSAKMPGFQTVSKAGLKLEVNAATRLDFELGVAGIVSELEVSASPRDMLLHSSATAGTVLRDKTIVSLLLVDNDVLSVLNCTIGAFRMPIQNLQPIVKLHS
jgi:hypothetical protein